MLRRESCIKSTIASLVIVGVCLLSFPTAAQHAGPQSKQATVSDDDAVKAASADQRVEEPNIHARVQEVVNYVSRGRERARETEG
jgi:hypothetical protein